MSKQIIFNEEARAELKKGIDKLAKAVRMTLGPRGRAAVIDKGYGAPQVTFDGVTVAKEIELPGKYENLGAEFIKQAAEKTNDAVGDGTTTAVVLAHAMIEEGEKAINEKGLNVIQLGEELKKGSETIIKILESQRELINDNKKIQEVATLAAKNSEIGELIAKVMQKVGRDGVVTIEDSNTISNTWELVEGMQFDHGYISPYMITNSEKMEAIIENPYILITEQKISAIADLLPLLEKIVKSGKKELVIIADDIEGEALTTLVVNKLRGTFNSLAIKAPGFGDKKKEMLADIAVMTGANLISEELGRKLASADISDLGQAHRIIATKETTTIVNGKGDKKEIEKRINQIKIQLQKTEQEFDKDRLQERLGKLSGGVAIIKIGAPTESAQKELKQRVEDAVAATKAAMEEGIVPGGGMGLFNIVYKGYEMPADVKKILDRALEAPLKAIIENSGEESDKIISELRKRPKNEKELWVGFNAVTNKIEDLKIAGIIDPLKVTKTAFINAVSVASNYLTIGVAIAELPEQKTDQGGAPHTPSMDME